MNKPNTRFARLRVPFIIGSVLFYLVALNTCDLFKPGLGNKVDITPPVVAVSSPAQNEYLRGTISVSGTASDDLGTPTLNVTYVSATSASVSKTVTVTNGTWGIDIPSGTGGAEDLPEGEQKISIMATDTSGKSAEAVLIVFIDNIAPTVLVNTPQFHGANRSVYGTYVDIKGEAWDPSPITGVTVKLLDGSGTQLDSKRAYGTSTWSARFENLISQPSVKTYYRYSITVVDKAGNENSYYYHSTDILALLPSENLFPSMDEIGALDQARSGSARGITYDAMYASRIGYSGGAYGDFDTMYDSTKPDIHLTNLDPNASPITKNVIGERVPITGYVNPGPAATSENVILPDSIEASIIPNSQSIWPATPNISLSDIQRPVLGSSVSFQIEPKPDGTYITSGWWKLKLRINAGGRAPDDKAIVFCTFRVDSGAPTITDVDPIDGWPITRLTYDQPPLVGQTGYEILAKVEDDSTSLTFSASYSFTSESTGFVDVPAGNIGAETGGWYRIHIPSAGGNTNIWLILQATDDTGAIGRRTLHYSIDETDPAITVTSVSPMKDPNIVNGTIALQATVTDASGVSYVGYNISYGVAGTFTEITTNKTAPTLSIDTTSYTDDTDIYVYLRATDTAGNTYDLDPPVTLHVDQSSDRPEIQVTSLAAPPTVTSLGQNPTIFFTIQDDDADTHGVRGDNFEYSLDGGSIWNPLPDVSDSTFIQTKVTLMGQPQGLGAIRFRAMDTKETSDWALVYGQSSNYHWNETVDYQFAVDYGPPTVTLTGPTSGSVHNSDITVNGTTQDFMGVLDENIVIEVTRVGGGYSATYTSSSSPAISVDPPAGSTDITLVSFTLDIPISTLTDVPTGEYNIQVRCTDGSGATATVDRPIAVDKTAPTNTFSQPASGATVNGTITAKGEVSDNRQVAHVYLWHGSASLTPPSDPTTPPWVDLAASLLWTYASVDTTSVANGAYKIVVITEDGIGNRSTPYTLNLTADQSSDRPEIALTNLTEGAPAVNNPLGRNAKIFGNVQDDDGINPTGIEIRIDVNNDGDFDDGGSENWAAVSSPPPSTATLVTWSHDVSGLAEGIHKVQVRSWDKYSAGSSVYGNASDYTWNDTVVTDFFVDFGPPVLGISGPANGTIETATFDITGTASDSFGIDTVEISIDGGGFVTVTSTSGDFATWEYEYTISGPGQNGVHNYQVKAADDSGAVSTQDRQFVVDVTAPTSTINTPQASATTNGTILVSGTANDNYQLPSSAVYYAIRLVSADAPSFPVEYEPPLAQSYSWQFNFNTTTKTDGDYRLYVMTEDAGGNPQAAATTRDFTINQASDRPVVAVSTLLPAGSYTENLLPNTLQVAGTVSDDDSAVASSIQFAVDNNEDGDFTDPGEIDWTAVSSPGTDGYVVTWSHTFASLADGHHRLYVRAYDMYDGGTWGSYSSSSIGPINFSVDSAPPTGSVTFPAQGAYLNNSSAFDITGTADDSNGIQSVKIKFGSTPEDVSTSDSYAHWSYNYTPGADGQVSFQIIITDNFGKISTIDRYFTMDRTAPTVTFIQPNPGATVNGSLLVRGSADDAYQVAQVYFAIAQTPPAFESGYEPLPGTYSWQKRIKTTSYTNGAYTLYVVARDAANNNNSASPQTLNITINSATNDPVVTFITTTGTLFDNTGTVTGTISDDDGINTSSVQVSIDGGGWTATGVSVTGSGTNVNFSYAVSGLTQRVAAYPIQVRATDVGEDFPGTDDDIPPVTGYSSTINIYKDDAAPTASVTNLNNGYQTFTTLQSAYIKDRLTINGTSTDGTGGQVSTVEARLVGVTDPFETVTDGGSNFATWSWSRTGLTLTPPSVNLEVKVTDVHGRNTTYAYTLMVDTTAPTVTIETPATNPDTTSGAYNGSVTFRGSAADAVKIEKVYYIFGTAAASAPTNWNYTGWTEAGSTYSWTTSALDTNALYNDAIDHTYHLSAVTVDSAGNQSSVQDLSFTINQGSDNPAQTISQPTPDQELGANAKALGAVTDDDGLASIEIAIDRNNDGDFLDANEGYVAVTSPATVSGKNVNFEHNFSASPALTDGAYRIQVRSRDSGYNAGDPPATRAHHETESSVVSFTIDTAPPSITLDQITVTARYVGDSDRDITSGFNGSYINNDSTFYFSANDASGIASVEFSSNGTDWYGATYVSGDDYTYLWDVLLTGADDGTRTIQYRATDNHSKVTSGIVTLIVDTAEPVVSFTTPSGVTTNPVDNAPNVNGNVLIQGTVSDSSSVTSLTISAGPDSVAATAIVAGARYRIVDLGDTDWQSIGADSTPAVGEEFIATGAGTGTGTARLMLVNTGNTIAWITTLSNSGSFANATYATDQTNNVWRLPVTVTAVEYAYNRTILTGYIDVDPDSDRPIVNVVSPLDEGTVAGVFIINGTVIDDDGAQSVDLQVDLNHDGDYNDVVNLNGDGDTTDEFENESVPVNVAVTNNAWSKLMNTGGELNKANLILRGVATADGWIGIRATPIDINSVVGDPADLDVYIDSEAPLIKGLDTDGVTEVAAPTPASGTLQKGTVYLRAIFKDDMTIPTDNMQVSFDGGQSYQNISSVSGATIQDDGLSGGYYTYRITIPIQTTTVVSGGNGVLQISLKVTDQTYKQTSQPVQYNVDNTYPEVAWNLTGTKPGMTAFLPYQGTPPDEIYSLYGTGSTIDNEVFGMANDRGTISGIAKVNVYFVKGGNFINPSTGATLATSNQTVRQSSLDLNDDGDYLDAGEYEGTDHSIPFTENSSFVITINKRTELGQFDTNPTLGDNDGFNESLKAKSGYDEWYAYLNTTVLPDGPIDIYFVAYDEAGNMVYDLVDSGAAGKAEAQVANYPPSITGFSVGGTPLTGNPIKAKYSGTFTLRTDASDSGASAGVTAASWKVTVTNHYNSIGGDVGTEITPFTTFFYGTGGVADFSYRGSGTPAYGEVPIDTTYGGFTEGDWYKLVAEVTDNDGNVTTAYFYLRINNSDSTPPSVTINDFTQTSVNLWTAGQGPYNADIAAASINTSTEYITVTLPTGVGNGTKVAWAGGSAPGGMTAGTVYYVINNTGTSCQLSTAYGGAAVDITSASGTYDLVCGGHVEDVNESNHNGVDADLSGAVKITGTVQDDTDVSSLHVEIDGVDQGTAVLSNQTGNPIIGYTYDWTFLWDTAKQGMATVAKDNVVVRAYGIDPANNYLAAGARPTKTVDVVPYITSITDPTGLSTDVLRGATGKYSIGYHASNTLTVRGYNLGTASVSPTAYVSTGTDHTGGVTPGTTWVSSNQITVSKNLARSGWLTVVVSTVPSINNVTNNSRARNIETTADPRTAQWTDDRYIWVWAATQVNLTTLNGTGANVNNLTYYNPDMVMNGNQPEFSFNDENNGITVYTTSDTVATRRYGYRLTRPAGFATATVSSVLQRFIVSSFDSTWMTSGDNTGYLEMTGFGNQTTDGNGQTNGPSVNTDGGINWPTIQGIDYYAPNDETLQTYRNVNRFPHPKVIAATSNPNTGANIWLAYYDSNLYHKSLNFISFRMTGTGYNGANLIAAAEGFDKSPDVVEIPGTTGGASSEYFSMARVGTNGIAIAYYDATAMTLKLAYNGNAYNSTGVATTENLTNIGRESSLVTVTDGNRNNWLGKYFTVFSGASGYDIWYDRTGGESKPGGATQPNNIRVVISSVSTTNNATNRNAIVTLTLAAVRAAAPSVFELQRQANAAAAMYILPFSAGNVTSISGNLGSGTVVGSNALVRDGGSGSTWSILTLDSSGDVGQHVSMAANGTKLYITYYDFDNADLKMARVSWDGTVGQTPSLDQTIHIDNYLSAGTWTNIMMLTDSNLTGQASAQPVIAYYADSYNGTKKPIRFAFPLFDATTGAMSDGTASGGVADEYSGNWDVVTVPAVSSPQGGSTTFNRVNLGAYTNNGLSLPVIGWLGTKLEYAKLQPNN